MGGLEINNLLRQTSNKIIEQKPDSVGKGKMDKSKESGRAQGVLVRCRYKCYQYVLLVYMSR